MHPWRSWQIPLRWWTFQLAHHLQKSPIREIYSPFSFSAGTAFWKRRQLRWRLIANLRTFGSSGFSWSLSSYAPSSCAPKGGIGLGMFFSWKKGSGSFYPKACSSMTETSRPHHALSMVNGNLRVPPQCYPEGNRPYQEVNYGMINDQTSCAQLKLWTIDILSLSRLRMRELGFSDPKWLALWLSTHLPFLPQKRTVGQGVDI